tara:strand:+ start:3458 stop:3742 length:285 start_codon:yes stop_codon:yes gene_type:complete
LFNDREKSVIKWAELVTWNTAKNDNDAYEELSKHFDSAEIVELTMVACFRGLMNRFMDSLQIELEDEEVQSRGGIANAKGEDLQLYVKKMAELL